MITGRIESQHYWVSNDQDNPCFTQELLYSLLFLPQSFHNQDLIGMAEYLEKRKSPLRRYFARWKRGKEHWDSQESPRTVMWKKNSPAILLWREYEGRRYFCIAFWKILILFNGINQRREELLRWNHSLGWVVKDQGNKQGSSSGSAQSWSSQNLRVSQGGSALAYWREVIRNDWSPS